MESQGDDFRCTASGMNRLGLLWMTLPFVSPDRSKVHYARDKNAFTAYVPCVPCLVQLVKWKKQPQHREGIIRMFRLLYIAGSHLRFHRIVKRAEREKLRPARSAGHLTMATLTQPAARPTADNMVIRDVWADNLEHELEIIRAVVEQYPYIAMDTEFPGVVARPVSQPGSRV